jgi:hypothetical protein
MGPEGREVLIEVLAERRAEREKDVVLRYVDDADEGVRVAAIKALSSLADTDDLPELVELVTASKTAREQKAARETVVAVASTIDDSGKRSKPVLRAIAKAKADKRAVLIQALPGLGGDEALAAVKEEVSAENADLRDAAIRALADWPDAAAMPALMELARSEQELKYHALALQGYIRLAGEAQLSRQERVARYVDALAVSKRADEKRKVLSGLSGVHTIESLRVVADCLSDPELKGEAALAAAQIACPKNAEDNGLLDPEAVPMLIAAAEATEDGDTRKRIEDHIDVIPQPDPEGFVPLFNGKDLTGWVGDTEGYAAEDGMLVCKPGGNLYTDKDYGDFILRFEFLLPPGGNNGLAVRAPVGGGAYNGMELQILDNSADKYKDLQPYQYHGSIYGIVPAKRGFQRPVGEWNEEEVIAKGRQITVRLNGTVIVDANLDEATANGTMDHKEHKGLDLEAGRIGFLGHGDIVKFRNIRVKELE